MAQIDYEIITFYKAILHLFLASGALPPKPPARWGLPKGRSRPRWTQPVVNILRAALPPHFELGSNVAIPLNIEDN